MPVNAHAGKVGWGLTVLSAEQRDDKFGLCLRDSSKSLKISGQDCKSQVNLLVMLISSLIQNEPCTSDGL